MQRKSALTAVSVLLCIGAIAAGALLWKNRHYYIVSAAVLLFACLPFCAIFRHRRAKTRELVTVAAVTAVAVVSRGAFYMLPQIKPMCAIAMIVGIYLGAETGFVTGALAMFLSNFLFGQGAWTPFQVFGMGLAVFAAAAILRCGTLRESRIVVAVTGGLCCFVLYGLTVDSCSVLMMVNTYTPKAVITTLLAGVPFNAIHGVVTAVCLFLFAKPMGEKLERMQIKYGLFTEK